MIADALLALGFLAIGLWLGFGIGRVYEFNRVFRFWLRQRPRWPRRTR